jgi:hypothetical protein
MNGLIGLGGVLVLLLGSWVCFLQGQGEGPSERLVEAAILQVVVVEGGAVWR